MKTPSLRVNTYFHTIVLAIVLLAISGTSEDSSVRAGSLNGFNYTVSGSGAIATGCTSNCPASLIIPSTLDGLPVVGIGEAAFAGKGLTSVEIPDSVTNINPSAFEGNSLRSVKIGASVQQIGAAAFRQNDLRSITIPNSVVSIGAQSFQWNRSLTIVSIGTSVQTIGERAFDQTSLSTLALPNSIRTIGDRAFYGLALTSVRFGTGVERIGYQAFEVNRLTSLVLPASIVYLDAFAFGTNQLKSVKFLGDAPPDVSFVFDNNDELYSISRVVSAAGWGAEWGGKRVVIADQPVAASIKPNITGTSLVGKTLTAAKGTWTGYPTPTFTYQWYACSTAVSAARTTIPSTCKKITGATRSTFKLASAQRGKYVAVFVTGKSLRTAASSWLSVTTLKVK